MSDPRKKKLLYKHKYWEKGIPCHQFHKEHMKDVMDVIEIDNAFKERDKAINNINTELNNL